MEDRWKEFGVVAGVGAILGAGVALGLGLRPLAGGALVGAGAGIALGIAASGRRKQPGAPARLRLSGGRRPV